MVRRQLVVARCNPTAVLDLVEEPFDQIPSAIEIRAEANRLAAIAFWRDIGKRALVDGKGSDLVGIIAAICQQH
jgi:hypothetical protein